MKIPSNVLFMLRKHMKMLSNILISLMKHVKMLPSVFYLLRKHVTFVLQCSPFMPGTHLFARLISMF